METKPSPIVGLEKWQALGNDFIIVNKHLFPSYLNPDLWPDLARQICNRNLGIGADGLLRVERLETRRVQMILFNPDGSRAEMCGNGIRCVAAYALNYGWWPDWTAAHRPILTIETDAGDKTIEIAGYQLFRVDMGVPILDPEKIPVRTHTIEMGCPHVNVPIKGFPNPFRAWCVSMGNPHTILPMDLLDKALLESVGPKIERSYFFPERTNVEFVQIIDPHHVSVLVWERGVGLTQACGTGACAVVVIGTKLEELVPPVEVELPGGILTVEWDGQGDVFMSGPASKIADSMTYYYTPA